MIPGANLLRMAFGVIGTQIVKYRKFEQRVKNDQAQYVSMFEEPFDLAASVQRVRRDQYVQFNLEFQRNYVMIFANFEMVDLDRDVAGDQFLWTGRVFQLESQGSWFYQDGWGVCLAVDIGAAKLTDDGKPTF
ncbi:head protein [Pseudomonas phage Epa7]|uniref:Virion protein n=33 Tax=Viruses TaxID=10239 RepID=A0A2K8HS54_9CAUD|nr:putative structural protein [Staphylococcus aureus]YP_007238181.1 head protein [Pseudomonas phage KPP12]YP_009124348.1 head protein [Pseudomonas phage vB_PaeM_PAO1_Ab27]YP_009211354.1 head protein [Pseudomonas phage vB_Pae_PS44]YP_009593780.1 head protein [Pseudomonas phage vB_PaeM_CEB_DP1]YP_009619451.1 head protein [Pseudomonas phage vB_PaeM_E215]YP_009837360.1 head protein [Pseudomonas phage vB_PaeM_LS1]YP_009913866.1 head protein [Pseudomonas phage PaGU11]YP_009914001.1 head protein 